MPDPSATSYSANANLYDKQVDARWAMDAYGPKEQKKIDRLLSAAGPLEGLRILEPGCGTGRLTALLAAQVGLTGCVVAMDISPQMITVARQRLSGHSNVQLYLGAAEIKARSMGYFDQVICHQVFPHFTDQAKALKHLTAALNPFGLIVIAHSTSFAENSDVHRKAGAAVSLNTLPKADRMRTLCKGCGLKIEKWWDDPDGYLLSARRI